MSLKARVRLGQHNSLSLHQLEQWSFFLLLATFPASILLPPPIRKLVNLLSYIMALVFVIRHWRRLAYVFTQDILLVLLHGLAAASIFWSVAPDITIESVRALLRTSLLGVYFATCYSPEEQRKLLSKVFLTLGVLSFLLGAFIPGYGRSSNGNWVGVFSFKYGLGSAMVIGIALISIYYIKNRGVYLVTLPIVVIATAMIVLSQSKTSLLLLVVALSVTPIYFIATRQFKLRIILYALAVFVSAVGLVLLVSHAETIAVDWLGRDLTLTGRLPLWESIIRQGLKRPILGYGHGGAFWFSEYSISAAFESKNQWPNLPPTGSYLTGMHSHSGFVELFIQFGWIGLFLSILQTLTLAVRLCLLAFGRRNIEYLWMFQIFCIVIAANISENVTFLEANNLMWILYTAMSCSSAVQVRSG